MKKASQIFHNALIQFFSEESSVFESVVSRVCLRGVPLFSLLVFPGAVLRGGRRQRLARMTHAPSRLPAGKGLGMRFKDPRSGDGLDRLFPDRRGSGERTRRSAPGRGRGGGEGGIQPRALGLDLPPSSGLGGEASPAGRGGGGLRKHVSRMLPSKCVAVPTLRLSLRQGFPFCLLLWVSPTTTTKDTQHKSPPPERTLAPSLSGLTSSPRSHPIQDRRRRVGPESR